MTLTLATATPRASGADDAAFYESKIRPALVQYCYECHSSSAKKLKGDLRLDAKAGFQAGGSSGAVFVAGKPDESNLIRAIRRNHGEVSPMPPDKPLPAEVTRDFAEWVKRGAWMPEDKPTNAKTREAVADARQRWPFTPLPKSVAPPAVDNAAWPTTEVDRFVLAKLEAKSLTPVADADKRSWLRRVTFDLIGLPPTVAEQDEFLADDSPAARMQVIDRLLASPHYGERWGRHWLDVVRYADTAGDNSDFPVPQAYLYRNWVIDAVNRDLPYDRFVQEQLAGDLLPAANAADRRRQTIATGYIAVARRFGSRVDDYPQHLTIEDTLDNLGRAYLGLTLNCARCHDHKFDPLNMTDYYALYGFFHSTRYPWPGIELEQRQRDFVPLVAAAEADKIEKERKRQYDEIEAQIKNLYGEKTKAKDQAARDAVQKRIDSLKKEQREKANGRLPFPTAYAVADAKKVEDVAIQNKGDPAKPGAVVHRRFVEVLGGQALSTGDSTSGRAALAAWMTSPDNPLVARVIVNRVWHWHFGRGLVATPNDFGKQGAAPTHPELLDWLARRFVDDGWSFKKLHRLILSTRVYGLSATAEVANGVALDPNNELLAKFRSRRLDAESIRDAMLAVSGDLDRRPGGEHPFPEQTTWQFTQHNPFKAVYDHRLRSVYLMTQRIQRHPYLAIFDGPDASASTGSRIVSTTALQSLYFLNDKFVHERAAGLVRRIEKQPDGVAPRVNWTYRILFARPATEDEILRSVAYLGAKPDRNAWESYARVLLRLNEFVYVD